MATLADLVDRVEWHAERVTPQGESVGLNTTAIETQLQEAANAVLESAPIWVVRRLGTTDAPPTLTNQAGPPPFTQVEPPSDYLRFVCLMLSDWKRPVFELTRPTSDQHRLQVNGQTSADIHNPIVVPGAASGAKSGTILRGYPQDGAPDYHHYIYIAETAPENMPPELVDPMVLRAASRVLQSDFEKQYQALQERSERRLSALNTGERPMLPRKQNDDS